MKLIAFVGFKDSGKTTAAIPLIEHGYIPFSYADALKDCLASIFLWPRDMLEGITPESRIWRERVDSFWSAKLGIPDFSPRRAMQLFGTETMRNHFDPNVWIFNVERRISLLPQNSKVILIDGRFPNEITMPKRYGGQVFQIQKGDKPAWYQIAEGANKGDLHLKALMRDTYCVHESEYAWIGTELDGIIENNSSKESLYKQVLKKVGD